MKKGLTELVFILDGSGSMCGLEADTIGGFNSMINKQKKEPGEAIVTTVLFDDYYELIHDRININDIKPMTDNEYYVGGCTALLDAIGKTIHKIGNVQKHIADEGKAEKVIFVITTDGMENASREYTYEKIKNMIERQKTKYNWEFIFFGANIDAVNEGSKLGISEDRSVNFTCDSEGVRNNYEAASFVMTALRNNKQVDKNWKKNIENR